VKKISEEEFSHFCILGDGLLGWEPNVNAKVDLSSSQQARHDGALAFEF